MMATTPTSAMKSGAGARKTASNTSGTRTNAVRTRFMGTEHCTESDILPDSMTDKRMPDTLTVIAITVVAAAITDVLHEAVGHGGACLLTGLQPLVVSTVHFNCSADSRIVSAGGTIVNLIAGAICGAAGRKVKEPRLRYFFWLTMVFNLLSAGGYFLYSGIGNIGDWAYVIHDLHPAWAWRTGLTALGLVTYWSFALISIRE